ncbi:MAG: virulence RhuM family protein [Treponema sp.]|nr:virulence RhuM family protein [Candidatus Treponema scatequi]
MSLKVPLQNETVWLNQAQMIQLFGRDQSVISRHVKNVFDEQEVDAESNMQILHISGSDKPVVFYSLDVIISVGYRVKSKRGVEFRKWANSVLKQYIMNGYAENLLIPCDLVLKVICLVMKKINLLKEVLALFIRPLAEKMYILPFRKKLQIFCIIL